MSLRPRHAYDLRAISLLCLVALLINLVIPPVVTAQKINCRYDSSAPTLESVLRSRRGLEFQCAINELEALLALESTSGLTKAGLHGWLGLIYLENGRGRTMILGQFVEAFRSYPAWDGKLVRKTPELTQLIADAGDIVREEIRIRTLTLRPDSSTTLKPLKKPKRGLLKKILIAGGTVAAGVLAMILLRSDDKEQDTVAPPPGSDFPPHP